MTEINVNYTNPYLHKELDILMLLTLLVSSPLLGYFWEDFLFHLKFQAEELAFLMFISVCHCKILFWRKKHKPNNNIEHKRKKKTIFNFMLISFNFIRQTGKIKMKTHKMKKRLCVSTDTYILFSSFSFFVSE